MRTDSAPRQVFGPGDPAGEAQHNADVRQGYTGRSPFDQPTDVPALAHRLSADADRPRVDRSTAAYRGDFAPPADSPEYVSYQIVTFAGFVLCGRATVEDVAELAGQVQSEGSGVKALHTWARSTDR